MSNGADVRYCFDSITAGDIPAGVAIVAGYIDGLYRWTDADWALFPDSVKVRIAVLPTTNDGHVLDVEPGDATPDQSVGWVQMRRAAGEDPTVYTGIGEWAAVRAAFQDAGVAEPHYWIAHYDNDRTPIHGAIAKQFANPTFTGHHYDLSIVLGRWPGVEGDDVTPEEAKTIAKQAIDDAGLDPHTVDVIKRKLDGHIHVLVPNMNQTTVPLFPPVTGATYSGGAADYSSIVWDYPDGTQHEWVNGKEVLP